ncbi:hypothetical protein D8832_02875 [Streptococcus intermedius]|nr:hypothetical protein D8832_02875 [Streptococcus intermedius]
MKISINLPTIRPPTLPYFAKFNRMKKTKSLILQAFHSVDS